MSIAEFSSVWIQVSWIQSIRFFDLIQKVSNLLDFVEVSSVSCDLSKIFELEMKTSELS